MDYRVRLEVFEGPLDLLMHLIEKDQIDIYDIPIAQVTEQYLAYIASWNEFHVDVASEFLLMAATLLQIKSRMLLPKPAPAENVEEEEDPRLELVNRLVEYRRVKQLAAALGELQQDREQYGTRLPQVFPITYKPLDGLNIDQLVHAFLVVWESKLPKMTLVEPEQLNIQDKIADILYLLKRSKNKIEFTATLFRSGSRQELVVAFLAILELLRLKQIKIEQSLSFGPIYLMAKE